MSDPMEPVDVQNRRHIRFGESWDRAEAALPEGWYMELDGGGSGQRVAWCWDSRNHDAGEEHEAATAAEALEMLAVSLERRSLLEPNRGES